MTYVKVEQAHTDDERWIEAGSDAFALHVAALVYCDRQLLDGRITHPMATRVSLAVPPDRAAAAIAQLVELGFWESEGNGYRIVGFEEHAFPAEQVRRTRKRWETDKRRRQQHAVGDHSLCKDPKFCPAVAAQLHVTSTVESSVASTVESAVASTSGRSHIYQTQLDQTRPDRRSGSGSGSAEGCDGSAGPPGGSPASPRPEERFRRLPATHVFNPVDDGRGGDCLDCPLPRRHAIHGTVTDTAHDTVVGPVVGTVVGSGAA
jgi:hypothetical protein